MNIIICDDDTLFAENLKRAVETFLENKKCKNVYIKTFTSGEELLASQAEADLLFLDIEMGELSGFDVAEKINEKRYPPQYIFVTSHDQLVFNCFRFRPLYFLRKTDVAKGDMESFEYAMEMFLKKLVESKKHVNIIENQRIIPVKLQEIKYIESCNHDIAIKCEKREFKQRRSMKDIQNELEHNNFVRVHSGFLVNMAWIDKVLNCQIELKDKTLIPVSRYRVNTVKDEYFNYVGNM